MMKKIKFLSFLIWIGLILIACFAVPASAAAINGSNVWDQEQGMPTTYKWTPAMYSGMWYDVDRGVYTENISLSVSASDRQINAGSAEYTTEYKPMRFAYSGWGSYRVIGWQGEPYFAGYTRSGSGNMSTTQFINSNISTLSDYRIYPVLSDNSDEKRLGSGDVYRLENGYQLKVSDVNESARQFRLTLERNGNVVKNETVSNNTTFVYERELDQVGTLPVIAIHVRGLDGTRAVIDGVFQISESETKVTEGRKIGAMEIKAVNESRITMKNTDRIKLDADRTITLMGHIKIEVKDTSKLKFELVSDPKTNMEKTYSERGAVYDGTGNIKSWNGMNFPGFTYDYNNSTETENLRFDKSGSIQRSVPAKQIMYTTNAYNESFNYSGWGSYQSVNLGGENYFAGYTRYSSSDRNNTTNFTNSTMSLIKDGTVSKVLINEGNERQHNRNTTINLQEGYTLEVGNITENGSRINLILKKNGNTVKEAAVSQGENFVYEAAVGGKVVPIIAVRVTTIFSGTSEFIKIGGIFQISTDSTDVAIGKVIDNMRVEFTSNNALVFVNKDALNLSKGSDVLLMGNLSLHVADSEELRFFPFNKTGTNSNNNASTLRIEVPDTIYPNEQITIKVSYRDGSTWRELSGATVKVNGDTVGETNSSGTVSYRVGNAGSYEFRAEKSGYSAVSLTRSTGEGGDELQIILPDYIFTEDAFRLFVKDPTGINISGVGVYKGGEHLGTTNDNGMINVTADSTAGNYTLTANKSGYQTGTKEMKILPYGPYFAVTNTSIPDEILTGQTVKIEMTVENVGKEKDTQNITIRAENKTETKRVTLSPGETKNVSFRFKSNNAGESAIEVTNQSFSYTVTEKPKIEIPRKWILIGGGLILILVAAGAALFYYQQKQEEQKTSGRKTPKRKEPQAKGAAGGSKPAAPKAAPPAGKPKTSSKYTSSSKPPELKNSQKKARKEQGKK